MSEETDQRLLKFIYKYWYVWAGLGALLRIIEWLW